MNLPDVRSLGCRTDLILLQREGSVIEPSEGALIVRTPDQPTFHWGNYLLLQGMPATGEIGYWLDRFAQAFPGASHVAFGIDDPHSETETDPDAVELEQYNLALSREAVLKISRVPEPPRPNTSAHYRELRSDTDWDAVFELRMAIDGSSAEEHRQFMRHRVAAGRRLTRDGAAAWFGAFDGDQLVASLGIAMAGQGVARYQSVGTHPDHRRRGLAANLVARAGEHALTSLGARSLVIVAEADSGALRIYRSVGFTPTESQVGIER